MQQTSFQLFYYSLDKAHMKRCMGMNDAAISRVNWYTRNLVRSSTEKLKVHCVLQCTASGWDSFDGKKAFGAVPTTHRRFVDDPWKLDAAYKLCLKWIPKNRNEMYCKHIHGTQLRTRKRSHAHWWTHVANAHPTALKIVARSTNIVRRRQRHNATNIKINIRRRTCVRTKKGTQSVYQPTNVARSLNGPMSCSCSGSTNGSTSKITKKIYKLRIYIMGNAFYCSGKARQGKAIALAAHVCAHLCVISSLCHSLSINCCCFNYLFIIIVQFIHSRCDYATVSCNL